ncbi:MAG: UvrD-helicase domain-containing protein, partial [Bacteroidota bacterium]
MGLTAFQIYNASAGSGKTYTLVKDYLKLLLADNLAHHVKHVLAVTFTNKAVYEMKARVISNLSAFADKGVIEVPSELCLALCKELNINVITLHQRASKVLKYILYNYALFDIVTIDKFNHRLIKAFAYDLKIPSNFEVALDTELLLEEAVDNLIYKAGSDEVLTKLMVDFAIEKADDDKNWDIAIDLKKIAQLLLEENHYEHVEALKDITIYDFLVLGESLRSAIRKQTGILKVDAEGVLALLKKNHLEVSDFSRGTLPNHFKKIALENFNGLYNNKLEENLATGKLYAKTLQEEKASRIDALLPELTIAYHRLKKAVFHLKFLQNFYKNIVPLSLLNAIKNELEFLKAEQNVVLISEFNSIISKAIANQPAPFIYERLGEKYRHYFIDEFQDTSQMQWRNLKPLISNALESETLRGEQGTLCIVGDAKQAIYRWRGGNPEQFIRLYGDHNPFQVEKEVISLP